MQNSQYSDSYYKFQNNSLVSQSILDVFVLQDVLDHEDAERLKARFKTNRQIEDFLIKSKIVTRDTVNKAYSIMLKLPYVELKNVEIPTELKQLIPVNLIRKYQIVPFSQDDGVLRLAVCNPADMLANFQNGLDKFFRQKNIELELFITGESDFLEVIKQYTSRNNDLLLKRASLPVVYLRNQPIQSEFLNKFPVDFIEKYRLVVFGQSRRGDYLVACEQPDSPVTARILDFISSENDVRIEKFATSSDDIDYVLSLLGRKVSAKPMPVLTEKANTTPKVSVQTEQAEKQEPSPPTQLSLRRILGSFIPDEKEPEITIEEVPGESPAISSKTEVKDQPAVVSEIKSPEPVKNERRRDAEIELADEENGNNDLGSLISTDVLDKKSLAALAQGGSIPRTVAAIINFALNKKASDIHAEPTPKYLRVRCRIDGILEDIVNLPIATHPPFVSRIKILAKLKIDESRIPQDGRFEVKFKDREVDVRVSTLPTVHGEKVVMRILDKSQGILSLEDLGMQGGAFDATARSIIKPYGIILSSGPTGSGKSTTLYAILNRISKPGVNIVTLEDPVEYEIPGISQCQIKPEIGFTFATGLRSILRQDPNIIMVGEIRDAETAAMTTHAALTGHLVLSTLHTNDTAGALPRLINMGVEPFLITSSINLVIAQRLVRRICPKCREEMKVPAKLLDQLKAELSQISSSNTKDKVRIPAEPKLYFGKGCSECNHGFKGRIGIFEVMEITPRIEDLAVAKRPANEIKEAAIAEGMITMRQDGIIKAFSGLTTIDEVFQAVING